MSLKREGDSFIKPDPDPKRVKTEGGNGNFSLSSIPMAPTPAAFASSGPSAVAPKIEGGDRKPLGPAPNFGGPPVKNGKRKFFGNAIKARRGNDWVSAHFNRRNMVVEFHVHCATSKQWDSTDVEREIFQRLKKAKFDIEPSEGWGFLDRQFFVGAGSLEGILTDGPRTINVRFSVDVQDSSTKKIESSPYFKKDEPLSLPKSERFG